MNCRAITFDATGTLFYVRGGVGSQYAEVARAHGITASEERIEQAFREAWTTLPRPPREGGPSPDDDKGWWRALVEAVAVRADLEVPDFDGFFEALYAHFATVEAWGVFPEVAEVLEKLRSRHRLALISDFDGRLRKVIEGFGLLDHFELILISSEVGADKPDPQIFRAAWEGLGCLPGEVLHVGDDPRRDWEGARAAGMQAFELDRPRNTLRDLLAAVDAAG